MLNLKEVLSGVLTDNYRNLSSIHIHKWNLISTNENKIKLHSCFIQQTVKSKWIYLDMLPKVKLETAKIGPKKKVQNSNSSLRRTAPSGSK